MSQNKVGVIYQRPWGTYETLRIEDTYQVKLLTIFPQGRLSLQKHAKRKEHWIVVKGTPTLTIHDQTQIYHPNASVYIPEGTIHRIENLTQDLCEIIEVQLGTYLGEDDIVRLEDVYGR